MKNLIECAEVLLEPHSRSGCEAIKLPADHLPGPPNMIRNKNSCCFWIGLDLNNQKGKSNQPMQIFYMEMKKSWDKN